MTATEADRALKALVDDAHHRLHAATSLMSGYESRTRGAPADVGQVFAAAMCVEQAFIALERARNLPQMVAMRTALAPAMAAWSMASPAARARLGLPAKPASKRATSKKVQAAR